MDIINSLLSRNFLQESNSGRVLNFIEAALRASHFTTANHLMQFLKESDLVTILDPGMSQECLFEIITDLWNGKLDIPMLIVSQRSLFQQIDKKSTEVFVKLVSCCIEQSNTELLKVLLKEGSKLKGSSLIIEVKLSKSVPVRQRFDWMVISQNIMNFCIEKSDILLLQYLIREHSFKPTWLIRSFDLLSDNFEKLAKIVNVERDPLTNVVKRWVKLQRE